MQTNEYIFKTTTQHHDWEPGTLLLKGDKDEDGLQEFFNMSIEMNTGNSYSTYDMDESTLITPSDKEIKSVNDFLTMLRISYKPMEPKTFTMINGEKLTLSYNYRGAPIITLDTVKQLTVIFRNVHTDISLGSEKESEIYTYALHAEDKTTNPVQELYLEHINYNVVEHILLDCAYGIYTPNEFCNRYFDQLINKEEFNKSIFDNPESDWYWSDWELLLQKARIMIDGRTCYISYNEHTNDLCAYPIIE